jgi:hypothetical protein
VLQTRAIANYRSITIWSSRPTTQAEATLVLDSGAFIALERNDRVMWRRLKAALLAGSVPVSHGGVVGQVWRGGGPRLTSDLHDIEQLAVLLGRHVELIPV